MSELSAKSLAIIDHICDVLIANEAMLTDLDRAIGDGDHGANIKRGCLAIKQTLPSVKDADLATILTTAAMALLSKVGGASGPLLAGGLIKLAKTLPKGDAGLQTDARQWFLNGVRTFTDGIEERGHAILDDKTFVDYLEPFIAAFGQESAEKPGASLKELVQRASLAGDKGLAHTKDIAARKGRASYLGERSIGVQDPGATTLSLAFRALGEAIAGGS